MVRYVKIFVLTALTILLNHGTWCIASTHIKFPHGIILISLDTLRADHLGIHGYHRNTSPNIDAFAKEGVIFDNAVAQSPWTLPSHMSIMTSLYPLFHGVRESTSRLANEHVTLAELLREGGYQTAAFTDGVFVSGAFGFQQGFDIYNDQGRGIAQIIAKAKKWLDTNRSKPFFLFIHCLDIHMPYNPPPPYNTIFHDFVYTGNLTPDKDTLTAKLEVNDEDLRHFIALYDGGIRYTDEKIGEFLSYLRGSELASQSLIIITSDHGEEFKEHGSFLHWQLYYKPNLHVPLLIHIPGYPGNKIRIVELVQSIDLLPTILEIAGLPSHSQAQGRSLIPLIKSRKKNIFYRFFSQVFHDYSKDSDISFAEYRQTDAFYYSVITGDGYQMVSDLNPDYIQ